MEEFIGLVVLLLLFAFGGQLLKGIFNIFSNFGRIGGWVLGIILVIFIVKVFLFG